MEEKIGIYKINKKFDNVYTISNMLVSMILIVGDNKAMLIDTGYGFESPIEAIRTITDKELIVVNTHGHFDHAGGNCYFENVYLNSKDEEVLVDFETEAMKKEALKLPKAINFAFHVLPKNFNVDEYMHHTSPKTISLNDKDVFDLGNAHVEAVSLPGHTPGSMGLLYLEKKILFPSDAINGGVFLQMKESLTLKDYINTLYKAKEIDFEYMMQSHDTTIYPKDKLDEYIYVAENLDWEHGKKSNSVFDGKKETRQCSCKDKKYKSYIVTTKDRI